MADPATITQVGIGLNNAKDPSDPTKGKKNFILLAGGGFVGKPTPTTVTVKRRTTGEVLFTGVVRKALANGKRAIAEVWAVNPVDPPAGGRPDRDGTESVTVTVQNGTTPPGSADAQVDVYTD
jgi:hypothetical protein